MKNWKGTKEEVEYNGFNGVHTAKYKCVALTHNNRFSKHDAMLITDALNTVNKCDLMPSELLKERDELLEALKHCKYVLSDYRGQKSIDAWYKADELIKQIEG